MTRKIIRVKYFKDLELKRVQGEQGERRWYRLNILIKIFTFIVLSNS